jgi:hypothetical protein
LHEDGSAEAGTASLDQGSVAFPDGGLAAVHGAGVTQHDDTNGGHLILVPGVDGKAVPLRPGDSVFLSGCLWLRRSVGVFVNPGETVGAQLHVHIPNITVSGQRLERRAKGLVDRRLSCRMIPRLLDEAGFLKTHRHKVSMVRL